MVVRGKWDKSINESINAEACYVCSNCEHEYSLVLNDDDAELDEIIFSFCPNCGADMRVIEEIESEDKLDDLISSICGYVKEVYQQGVDDGKNDDLGFEDGFEVDVFEEVHDIVMSWSSDNGAKMEVENEYT